MGSKVWSFCDNVIIECFQCNFFQRKFAVTSVMKIYTKMWEFWVHLDYNHFYIPLISKYGKFQPQTIFLGNNNPFSIKPTVVRDKIPEKKHQYLRFEISLLFSKWAK